MRCANEISPFIVYRQDKSCWNRMRLKHQPAIAFAKRNREPLVEGGFLKTIAQAEVHSLAPRHAIKGFEDKALRAVFTELVDLLVLQATECL